MTQSCALRKIEGAQCFEPVKSMVPSIMICKIKLRFSSHRRAKVRRQGPPGPARAQSCDCKLLSYCCFKLTVCPRIKPKWRPIQLINSGFFKWFVIQGIFQFNRNIFRVLQDFMLEMKNELLRKQPNMVPGGSYIKRIFGLSTGTVITKEAKEPNNRVPLRALLFGWIVSFVVRNQRLGT